jgi:hypothetical protein
MKRIGDHPLALALEVDVAGHGRIPPAFTGCGAGEPIPDAIAMGTVAQAPACTERVSRYQDCSSNICAILFHMDQHESLLTEINQS